MHIAYLCPSPTFGMHQYTADLANRMVQRGHTVEVVASAHLPAGRYAAGVTIRTPIANRTTGFSAEALDRAAYRAVHDALRALAAEVVHVTSPHLWNPLWMAALRSRDVPVVHTLHDLDPHRGSSFGWLIRLWNRAVIREADHIIVHGERYRMRLLARGVPPQQVTELPLLHLFLGNNPLAEADRVAAAAVHEPWALFFGRLERYKGIEHLLAAAAMLELGPAPRVVIAGPGRIASLWAGALPRQVELRNRLIMDDEAIELFRRCGCLVLPYVDATQSALIAAAYFFHKPVVVTRSGALPEYVAQGQTGLVVEPAHPASLCRTLEQLLSAPARMRQMGEAGRIWYNSAHIAEEQALLGLYNRLGHRN